VSALPIPLVLFFFGLTLARLAPSSASAPWEIGRQGGALIVAQRAQPRTFNPVTALDNPSREIIRRTMGDLISINRDTHQTEPSLAESWTVSKDGLHYILKLRDDLHFSDGHAFTADDVVFSFNVYLDEKTGSPQRDLLIVGDKPIAVTKLNHRTLRFDLAAPYAAAERIFDSLAMLPGHLLQRAYIEGRFAQAWNLGTPPGEIAGMGPFRLKEYRAGERVVLERNPWYWKKDAAGRRLPYLDMLEFISVPDESAQVLRFVGGETSILNRVGARALSLLKQGSFQDLGPSLEYTFLFFNLGPKAKPWFLQTGFRQAVSAAIDRDAIVRLVFQGHASPLAVHVPPANRLWVDNNIPKPRRSLDRARQLLSKAGFHWNAEGKLLDSGNRPVEFSVATSAGNDDRSQIAAIVQEDLRQLGISATIAIIEFRSLIDRVTNTRDFDACILSLGGGDADPNAEMNVWLSSGATHLWNPRQKHPATGWEAEIDGLMNLQSSTLIYSERKKLFDRVQRIEFEQAPLISLVSPNLIVAATSGLGNFRPAVLDHYTLWNAEYLFWRSPPAR
jgi:peptide/nickel transport system substrate-binding protein